MKSSIIGSIKPKFQEVSSEAGEHFIWTANTLGAPLEQVMFQNTLLALTLHPKFGRHHSAILSAILMEQDDDAFQDLDNRMVEYNQ
jgi:hypothetical protein